MTNLPARIPAPAPRAPAPATYRALGSFFVLRNKVPTVPAPPTKAPTASAPTGKPAIKASGLPSKFSGVTLNKPRRIKKGDPGYGKKTREVFVKDPGSGKIKRVTFGDPKLGAHPSNPKKKKK